MAWTIFHIFLYIFYLSVFIGLIRKRAFFAVDVNRDYLTGFFILKVIAGVLLTLVYTYYYTDPDRADIYRYFNDSVVISKVMMENPLAWLKIMSGVGAYDADAFQYLAHTQHFSHPEHDFVTSNTLIIRINVMLNYFSFSSIWINTLFFNFFAFTGMVALYKALKQYFVGYFWFLAFPLFLIPSVVFWSSGLLKDALLFAGLGWFIYGLRLDSSILGRKVWLLRFAGFVFIFFIKPAVAACLVVSLVFIPLHKGSVKDRVIILIFGALVVGLVIFWMKPDWGNGLCEKLIEKRNEFVLLAIHREAGSYLETGFASTDCETIFSLLPSAWANAFLRPYLWSASGLFEMITAFENALLISYLILLLLLFFRKPDREGGLLAAAFLLFAVLSYLIIGLTVPVEGAIVHYRSTAIPFLVLAVMLCTDLPKLCGQLRLLRSKVNQD